MQLATFQFFSQTCATIGATTSKLEKARLLAEYLRSLDEDDIARAATWFTGVPRAAGESKPLQLGWALLRDALCAVGGVSETRFHEVYLIHSDLGETAFEILQQQQAQPPAMTLEAVDSLFREIAVARGPAAKRLL